jgi:dTMP kinase
MERGRYIAFEGAEACGKSTHVAKLAKDLGAVATRETGGTRIGQLIRGVLHDTANMELTDKAEALLIAADRAQHLAEVVEPALAAGRHVVSDRSAYSSLAYQSYGRTLPYDRVREINDWALGGVWPDLVVLIDVDAAELAKRMANRELDRFEIAGDEFHERVTDGFLKMAAEDPHRWVVIDGNRSIGQVSAAIRSAVSERLGL